MTSLLAIAFLFFVGATLGWCLEFLFRNLISHKGPRGKFFINPGFCRGPYLPIYGIGLAIMCTISFVVTNHFPNASSIVIIILIGVIMTVIELIGGLFLLKVMNMRLWDYRNMPGNFMGITCPLFSLIWTGIGAAYYLFIHKMAMGWIEWLSRNLAFSFFVGLFYGVFIIDLCVSMNDASIIKAVGDDKEIIFKYEELKQLVEAKRREEEERKRFFNQNRMDADAIRTAIEENAHAHEKKAEKKSKNK